MSLPKPPKLPALPQLPGFPGEAPPTVVSEIPGIAGGVVTAPGKGWHLVEYTNVSTGEKTRFSRKPAVVALAEVRFGKFLPVTLPTIKVPSIKVPKLSAISRIARHDFNSGDYCDLVGGKARDAAKNLSPPWPLNIIYGWFCDTLVYGLFYASMFGIGFIVNVLWDSFVQPQIDKVEDDIDAMAADLRSKFQDAINLMGTEIGAEVNEGLSDVIPVLYSMIGLEPGQLITLINTRNATTTSFEYYALSKGQKTHYIALGLP